MVRLRRVTKHVSYGEPRVHELAVIKIKNVAHELGYNIIKSQVTPGSGIDLEIQNPKNKRTVLVEIELSYASQIQSREKLGRRWTEIKRRIQSNKEDIVLLVFGVARDLLLKDLARPPANVPDACSEYGKRVFSAPSVEETSQIQAALLRCLGDE